MEEAPFKSRPKRLEETNPQRGESRRVCGRDKGLLSEPEGTDGVTAMADGRRWYAASQGPPWASRRWRCLA